MTLFTYFHTLSFYPKHIYTKQVNMQYTPLFETNSSRRSSIITMDPTDNISSDQNDYLCSGCRNKLTKKQEIIHTPNECLSERCRLLESEVIRLKYRDIKSRLQIKELESKVLALEDAMKGLVAPKQTQAAPFNFGTVQKLRNQLKKCSSDDTLSQKSGINYDNILPPQRSGSREHVGLFGSLGASSQYR